jgi:hypothetical protein
MTVYAMLARHFIFDYRAWERENEGIPLEFRRPVTFGDTPHYPHAAQKLYQQLMRADRKVSARFGAAGEPA